MAFLPWYFSEQVAVPRQDWPASARRRTAVSSRNHEESSRSSSMRDLERVGVGEVGAERLNDFDGADGIKTNWFGVHMRELYHTLFEVSKWLEK